MTKEEILKDLKTDTFGQTIFCFDTIDSTNLYSKTLSKTKAPHGTLIIAEEQTAGRGRMQRNWVSLKGKNLLFSIILYPDFIIEKTALLPFAGSLAVCDAIETVTGLSSTCKWPNDVLVNKKKVCGMLLESTTENASIEKIILGIGVNVNQEEFPEDLKYKASSLKNESGIEINRITLLQKILEELELRYEQLAHFPSSQLMNDWKMKALLFGKKITVLEHEFSYTATAIDVADDGRLIIQTDDGTKRSILAGDVSLAYT
ncbi:MAG: biotin--[acetyl-CoA-carboxylase] ligase [Bacteroidota bacterium]|nr:biotin--[acetyl-CoA-carboxylase] ligase [Bacteroidota bacterium]